MATFVNSRVPPVYVPSRRETFFIYDTDVVKKEEDDPFDAILYFYPEHTSADDQVTIVGHLVGMFGFFKSFVGSEPRICKLHQEKYAMQQHDQFIFALASGLSVSDSSAQRQLDLLCDIFSTYHCHMNYDVQSEKEDFISHQRILWRCVLPTIKRSDDTVGREFDSIPIVLIPKTSSDIFLQASNTLQLTQRMDGVYAGMVMFKSRVLCTQLTPDLTQLFLIVQSSQDSFPFREATLDLPLPSGVKILNIFLCEKHYRQFLLNKPVQNSANHTNTEKQPSNKCTKCGGDNNKAHSRERCENDVKLKEAAYCVSSGSDQEVKEICNKEICKSRTITEPSVVSKMNNFFNQCDESTAKFESASEKFDLSMNDQNNFVPETVFEYEISRSRSSSPVCDNVKDGCVDNGLANENDGFDDGDVELTNQNAESLCHKNDEFLDKKCGLSEENGDISVKKGELLDKTNESSDNNSGLSETSHELSDQNSASSDKTSESSDKSEVLLFEQSMQSDTETVISVISKEISPIRKLKDSQEILHKNSNEDMIEKFDNDVPLPRQQIDYEQPDETLSMQEHNIIQEHKINNQEYPDKGNPKTDVTEYIGCPKDPILEDMVQNTVCKTLHRIDSIHNYVPHFHDITNCDSGDNSGKTCDQIQDAVECSNSESKTSLDISTENDMQKSDIDSVTINVLNDTDKSKCECITDDQNMNMVESCKCNHCSSMQHKIKSCSNTENIVRHCEKCNNGTNGMNNNICMYCKYTSIIDVISDNNNRTSESACKDKMVVNSEEDPLSTVNLETNAANDVSKSEHTSNEICHSTGVMNATECECSVSCENDVANDIRRDRECNDANMTHNSVIIASQETGVINEKTRLETNCVNSDMVFEAIGIAVPTVFKKNEDDIHSNKTLETNISNSVPNNEIIYNPADSKVLAANETDISKHGSNMANFSIGSDVYDINSEINTKTPLTKQVPLISENGDVKSKTEQNISGNIDSKMSVKSSSPKLKTQTMLQSSKVNGSHKIITNSLLNSQILIKSLGVVPHCAIVDDLITALPHAHTDNRKLDYTANTKDNTNSDSNSRRNSVTLKNIAANKNSDVDLCGKCRTCDSRAESNKSSDDNISINSEKDKNDHMISNNNNNGESDIHESNNHKQKSNSTAKHKSQLKASNSIENISHIDISQADKSELSQSSEYDTPTSTPNPSYFDKAYDDYKQTEDSDTNSHNKFIESIHYEIEENPEEDFSRYQNDLRDRKKFALYVQSHSQTMLLLLMDADSCENPKVFHKLSTLALPQLAELDFKVAECIETTLSKGTERLKEDQRHSLHFDPFQKTLKWSHPSLSKDFVKMAMDTHNKFSGHPDITELTCRNHVTGIHAEQMLCTETFRHLTTATNHPLSSPFKKQAQYPGVSDKVVMLGYKFHNYI